MSDIRIGDEQDIDRQIEDAVTAMLDELRALGLDDEQILEEVRARA